MRHECAKKSRQSDRKEKKMQKSKRMQKWKELEKAHLSGKRHASGRIRKQVNYRSQEKGEKSDPQLTKKPDSSPLHTQESAIASVSVVNSVPIIAFVYMQRVERIVHGEENRMRKAGKVGQKVTRRRIGIRYPGARAGGREWRKKEKFFPRNCIPRERWSPARVFH